MSRRQPGLDGGSAVGTHRASPPAAVVEGPATAAAALRRRLQRDPLRRRMLAAADALAVIVAAVAVVAVERSASLGVWTAFLLPLWLLMAKLHGLYDRDHRALRHLTADEAAPILMWSLSGTAITALFLLATPAGPAPAVGLVLIFAAAACSAFLCRGIARLLWRLVTPRERAVIVGVGPLATATRRKVELFPDMHLDVVHEIDESSYDDAFVWPMDVDRVIVASQSIDEELLADLVSHCRRLRIKLSVVPPIRGMFGTAAQLNHVADLPVVEYNTWPVSRSTLLLKRLLDVTVSSLVLVVLVPVAVPIALAILVDSGRPVLFSQTRAGAGGTAFRVWKFRTMIRDAERRLSEVVALDALADPMFKLRRDPRVTRLGRFLRRTSLDELPQLWNVVRGEMSLVGPRPEQVDLVARYRPEHLFRISVKPGLTGPMQIYGRGELTFDERLAVEREYVENLSLARDLRILALTVVPLVSGRGAF